MMEKNINIDRDNRSCFFPAFWDGTTSVIHVTLIKHILNLRQNADTKYNSFEEHKSSTQLDRNKLKKESVINIEKEFKCTNNLH